MKKGERKAVGKKPAENKKMHVADLVTRLKGACARRDQVNAELDAANSERSETIRLLHAALTDVGIDRKLLHTLVCPDDQPC